MELKCSCEAMAHQVAHKKHCCSIVCSQPCPFRALCTLLSFAWCLHTYIVYRAIDCFERLFWHLSHGRTVADSGWGVAVAEVPISRLESYLCTSNVLTAVTSCTSPPAAYTPCLRRDAFMAALDSNDEIGERRVRPAPPPPPQVTSELTAVIKEVSRLGGGAGGDGGESCGSDASAKLDELLDRLTKLKATVRITLHTYVFPFQLVRVLSPFVSWYSR